jgi:hypothetical protein
VEKKGVEADRPEICVHIVKPYMQWQQGRKKKKGEACDVSEAGNQLRQREREREKTTCSCTALSLSLSLSYYDVAKRKKNTQNQIIK